MAEEILRAAEVYFRWPRTVFDESRAIKNCKSFISLACRALLGKHLLGYLGHIFAKELRGNLRRLQIHAGIITRANYIILSYRPLKCFCQDYHGAVPKECLFK
jgi:hypothetical protein